MNECKNIVGSVSQQNLWYNRDLIASARQQGGYRLACQESGSKPILDGALSTRFMQPGLSLHTMDAKVVQPFKFETELQPCLKVAVVFRGQTRVHYGDRDLHLDASRASPEGRAVASLIALNRPEHCVLQDRDCGFRRSLTLSLSPQWLEQQQLGGRGTRAFLGKHLNISQWRLPQSVGLMAHQLFALGEDDPASRLMREGFALTLAGSLIQQLEQGETIRDSRALEGRREQQLLELLHSGEADELTMAEIGHRLGMSAATLQRYSRKTLGTSLSRYLRRQRLTKAYQALLKGEVSVAQAAALAGYNHAANFATAFRRAFGVCPKTLAAGKRLEP